MITINKYVSYILVTLAAGTLAGCHVLDPEFYSDSRRMTLGVGTPVPAAAETVAVGTTRADAADDPEIWVDPTDPTRAVILGTDKQAGLYAYDLDGQVLSFIPDGRLNNVDLRGGFPTPWGERVLVAASDRGRMGAALYLMHPSTFELTPWGIIPLDLSEPYGLCVGRRGDDFLIFINSTDGQIRQVAVRAGTDGAVEARGERQFSVPTQPEGCVVDDARGRLYLGEEAAGIWRFNTAASGDVGGRLIETAPSDRLAPDVEGLTLLHEPGGAAWLIASSQGDSAFAVYRADGPDLVYRGRFSVHPANGVDAVTGTDGVAALGGAVGPYGSGLVVMQDDADTEGEALEGRREQQNFKLVDWAEIRRALEL
ncbi:phytase [Brevundimonas aveniformis]|uniref:phytase n=1 Tax=Brevundimonas aveniformis TaxID=370977 RepID=UPI00249023C0|nr:phytase [Brevundimonas aveniformis]